MATSKIEKSVKDITARALTVSDITIPANGTYTKTDLDASSAIPQGYEGLAIVPAVSGGNNVYFYNCRFNTAPTWQLQLKNTASSQAVISTTVIVISVKK